VDRLGAELGEERALAALEQMNQAATVTRRDDGYVQDLASQWVAELVEAGPGDRVADLCAAPGGKATWMAARGARVVASDRRAGRAHLVLDNARRLGSTHLAVVTADGTRPPYPPATFDRVLVDAPCSNLGALRRRPDARWRIGPDDVDALAGLQAALVDAAVEITRPGGVIAYSVCTLTDAEGLDHDRRLARSRPDLVPLAAPPPPWEPLGRGARLLPQAAGTDGMVLLRYRRGRRDNG
jgi:16S rRNA (cytosine967-C5)-methyltransferase